MYLLDANVFIILFLLYFSSVIPQLWGSRARQLSVKRNLGLDLT